MELNVDLTELNSAPLKMLGFKVIAVEGAYHAVSPAGERLSASFSSEDLAWKELIDLVSVVKS